MTTHSIENPAGTDGFEFLEFAAKDKTLLENLFKQLGFVNTAIHKSLPISLWQQGDLNFIINADERNFAREFTVMHGPCVCGMAFRVFDKDQAYKHCVAQGAKAYVKDHWTGASTQRLYGIGESILYLVDDYKDKTLYEDHFNFIAERPSASAVGLTYLDHVTHNVFRDNMDTWADFYKDIFNFKQVRFFDIKGKFSGLVSRAMTSPCGKIRIPINESTDKNSQIEEYLKLYNGEGIQHIACGTEDIYHTVETLKDHQLKFLDIPETYYEQLESRLPQHGEDLARLNKNFILMDGETREEPKRILLQIFTETVIGPVFFEVIQRKGDEGFGEGNFQALFESMELDQIRRGVVSTNDKKARS